MAKRGKTARSYRKPQRKIPLLTVAGMIPGIANMQRAYSDRIHGGTSGFADLATEAGRIYIGLDRRTVGNTFNATWMWGGTFPLVIGAVGSKIAGKLGVNRMFRNLPIKL